MSRLVFHPLPVQPSGASVRIDTASGSNSPASGLLSVEGSPILSTLASDGVSGAVPAFLGPDGTATLYVKTLSSAGAVTATATLAGTSSGSAPPSSTDLVAALVNGAPGSLDTLGEVATALAALPGAFAPIDARDTSITNFPVGMLVASGSTLYKVTTAHAAPFDSAKATSVGGGAVASVAGRTGAVTLAKADVGLGNVDNTADSAKPVSTATQTALNLRMAKATVVDRGLFVTTDGDDSSNDGLSPGAALATLEAALAKLPTGATSRGLVQLLSGVHTLTGTFSGDIDNVEIVGMGGTGQTTSVGGGPGGVTLVVPDGHVGLTLGDGSNLFRGPILRHLHFRANSAAALGALRLRGYSNWTLDDVSVDGFTAGYGFFFDSGGGSGLTMYGEMLNCDAYNCQVGVDIYGASGVHIVGGTLDNGGNNAGTIVAGSTGIKTRGPNSEVFAEGVRIQSYATHVDIQGGGGSEGSQLHGLRCEGFDTAVKINQPGVGVFGGAFNDSLRGGSGAVAFDVLASGTDYFLAPSRISSVGTDFQFAAGAAGTGVHFDAAKGLHLPGGPLPQQVPPTGVLFQNFDRDTAVLSNGLGGPNSGQPRLCRIWLPKGVTVSSIQFCSGGTALTTSGTGPHCWAALYDSSLAFHGQSPDNTAASWAANTVKTFTLGTPYKTTYTGYYYVALMIAPGSTGTMPSFTGMTTNTLNLAVAPVFTGNSSTTGLGANAPDPVGSATASPTAGVLWCAVA